MQIKTGPRKKLLEIIRNMQVQSTSDDDEAADEVAVETESPASIINLSSPAPLVYTNDFLRLVNQLHYSQVLTFF